MEHFLDKKLFVKSPCWGCKSGLNSALKSSSVWPALAGLKCYIKFVLLYTKRFQIHYLQCLSWTTETKIALGIPRSRQGSSHCFLSPLLLSPTLQKMMHCLFVSLFTLLVLTVFLFLGIICYVKQRGKKYIKKKTL